MVMKSIVHVHVNIYRYTVNMHYVVKLNNRYKLNNMYKLPCYLYITNENVQGKPSGTH